MRDYLIVGFGLAGMALSAELENRQQDFLVIDKPGSNASQVAGGIMNPLVLKWFTKSWRAGDFIPTAKRFYKTLEDRLKIQAFYERPVYRRLTSVREQNDWFSSSDKAKLKSFMDDELKTIPGIKADYKFGKVKQSGFLDTQRLLSAYKDHLIKEDRFVEGFLDYKAVNYADNFIDYKGHKAKRIVFCEGIQMKQAPFFNHLPLKGNKGEFLVVKIPALDLRSIVKSSIYLIPLGRDLYKIGATYQADYKNLRLQQKTRDYLLEQLEKLTNQPYSIKDHLVGIRPTVKDRRPLLGKHPECLNMLIFNGLGTRGVMMAPTLAQWLIDFDCDHITLPTAVNINRFP